MFTSVLCHFGLVAMLATAAFVGGCAFRRPEITHALWLLVFIKLLVPPFVEVPLLPARRNISPIGQRADAVPRTRDLFNAAMFASDHSGWMENSITTQTASTSRIDVRAILIAMWIVGAALYAAILIVSTVRFQRSIRGAAPPPDDVGGAIAKSARQLGIRRLPRVLVVDQSISPALWPSCPATVLLPRCVVDHLTDSELLAVILHELVHFQRRDHWARGLELIVLCIYWWLPPAWWFRRELRRAEEACCDRRVIHAMQGDAGTYAEALLKTVAVMAQLGSPRLPRVATGASAMKPMRRRITMIMQYRPADPISRIGRLMLLTGVAALLPLLPAPMQHDGSDETSLNDPLFVSITSGNPAENPLQLQPRREPPVQFDPLVITLKSNDQDADKTAAEPPVGEGERELLKEVIDLVAEDDLAGALGLITGARHEGSSAAVDFTLGNILLQLGRLEEATAAYTSAVEKTPQFARAWRNLGITLMRLERAQDAVPALVRTLELGADDATTYGMLGWAYTTLGDFDAAESAYWMAYMLDPEMPDWRKGLVTTLFAQRRMAEVIAVTDEMALQQPDNVQVHLLRANALVALGRMEEAGDALQAVEQRGGATPEVLHMLGDVNVNLGRHNAALRAYLKAIELDPTKANAVAITAARALLAKGALEQSRAVIRHVRPDDSNLDHPDQQAALLLIEAQIAAAEGRTEDETKILRRVLALAPNHGEAMMLLAAHYMRLGDVARAQSLLERGATIAPIEADAKLRLGQLLAEQGRYQEAVAYLRLAQQLQPRDNVQQYLERVARLAGQSENLVPGEPEAQALPSPRGDVLLALTDDGTIVSAGSAITIGDVQALIKRQLSEDGAVTIEADANASAGVLVRLIDECKLAGASRVNVRSNSPKQPVDVNDLDAAPAPIRQPAPALTEELRERAPASVTVVLIVNDRGKVDDAKVQQSTDEAFNQPAIDAVRTWEFTAGLRNGIAVPFRMRVPMTFPREQS